ncbi:ABC transporter permease [Rubrimonas cliftonensis]|uniref:Peptide/nickel transport system permease protein n=1 Tax=Rubrimonas cliftonensis TaxID=89524 RepID=A0A1H4GFR8_9RHOB|nr:ABC transporter permease [Rubrimonas cliftonensis]SEB07728.1 peptide/nickel transport system permease protein [Rubrimonas cliftonensis]
MTAPGMTTGVGPITLGGMRPGRVIGLVGAGVIVALTITGPDLVGYDPARQNLRAVLAPPGTAGHLLGTDHLGRDMAARILGGAQLTLGLAALAVGTAAAFGVSLGMLAGWRGGWTDRLLGAFADGVLALPGLLLVMLLAAIRPDSWWTLYAGLSLTLWVEFFRVARQRARVLTAGEAVQAAELLGLGRWHIVRRHLWPDLAQQVLTLAAFGGATVVTALATLGFISVGLRPPTPEWGVMMSELLPSWRSAPWAIAAPILALATTVLCLRLIAGEETEA